MAGRDPGAGDRCRGADLDASGSPNVAHNLVHQVNTAPFDMKSTFDVNKNIEPKHILKVMQDKPELFSDLPPIPADAALKPGYVFKP